MAWKYYHVGLNHVGSYQVAGRPFITGSDALSVNTEMAIKFPKVARSVTVINYGAEDLYVHFQSTATGRTIDGLHYIPLDSDEDSITMNVKCHELYVSRPNDGGGNGSFRVIAELTNITGSLMYPLTGSGLTT